MQGKTNLTLGSLFDGSGGFPLAGIQSGITPVWASEIEPFPIRVTTKRLPYMKHYGNVSEIDGGTVEPVDIITFGSPCQDMSVAGKRAGLDGSRSNLFYEAVRIIKEMRIATGGRYPKWACWENVPGAFSSSGGEDFRCVLESLCRVKDEEIHIPKPEKWANAGEIVGDGFSVAWRLLDAQYWGVPQRRKRIFLVADFNSGSAGKILFESEGMSGYNTQGFGTREETAGYTQDSAGVSGVGFDGYNGDLTDDKSATLGVNCGMSTGRNGVVLNDQGGDRMDITEEVTCTLRAEAHHPPCVMEAAGFCTEHSAKARGIGYEEETAPTLRAGTVPAAVALESHPADSRVKISEDGNVQTLTTRMGTGGGNVPLVMKIRSGCEGGGKGALVQTDKSATLACNNDQTVFVPYCRSSRPKFKGDATTWKEATVANTLNNFDVGESRCNEVAVSVPCSWDGGQVSPTLTKQNAGGSQRMPDKDNFNCVLQPYGICSKDSNSMKSANPDSGVYEADTSRTVDTSGTNPTCNQGGIAVVCVDMGGGKSGCGVTEEKAPTLACTHGGEPAICVQGSMIGRKDENGPQGTGINEDVSFTLNATDRHAVYSMTTGSYQSVTKDKISPLMARDFKDPPVVTNPSYGIGRNAYNQGANARYRPAIEEELEPTIVARGPGAVAHPYGFDPGASRDAGKYMLEDCGNTLTNGTCPGHHNGVVEAGYSVRRLTPTECARLQGFPDWWCSSLETEELSEAEMDFWRDVFKTYSEVTGAAMKTDKRIQAWLKSPHSDSAEYKMWGNGVALPCVRFVLSAIAAYAESEGETA